MFVVVLGLSVPAQAQDGSPTQVVGSLQIDDVSGAVMQAAQASVAGPEGRGKEGPMASVGLELALLYHQHQVAGPEGIQALSEASAERTKANSEDRSQEGSGRMLSPISANGQFVTVDAVASDGTSRLLADLRRLGLKNEATAGTVVSGQLPISAIKEAAGLSALRGMMPSYARTTAGSVESEADTAHAANAARLNTGTDGSGQKVCALSDSHDSAGTSPSASDDVNSGDLPGQGNPEGRTTPVEVLDEYNGTDPEPTDEGRAMLQLIHDIAPGATLGFHTAFGGIGNFASGIRELADAGCTVIVDDVRYFVEPFYQDGPVSSAINDVANNDNVSYFSSAGNSGQNSYEAPFRSSGESGVINSSAIAHDFNPEGEELPPTDTRQEITIEAEGTLQVIFQWTDPSALVQGSSGPDTDLDIALVDENDNILAQSADDNITNGVPFEFFEYTNEGSSAETLFLVIEKATGPDPEEIKYVYSGSGPFTDSDVSIDEYDTLGPTTFGHPMAENAMAVAAAPFFNTSAYNPNADPAALEAFSSKGGIQIRFNQNGDELGTPEDREAPDVTGTDRIDNTFFGVDIPDDFFDGIDSDPHPNFPGTSASAPNIAAIAALIKQARPGLAPTDVYSRLEEAAADVTTRFNRNGEFVSIASGRDPWSGHGFVQAEEAVPAVGVAITDPSAEGQQASGGDGAVTLTWRQVGGGEDVTVSEFVIKQRYFGGRRTERVRVSSDGPGEYSRTVEDLPVGRHQFRIEGQATTSAGEDTLLVNTTSTTLRSSGVNLTVYPNPFSETANLSITLPGEQNGEQRVTVRVFDILGRQVATPVSRPISDSESISLTSSEIRSLGSGVYFFRVTGETFQQTTKAVRVR